VAHCRQPFSQETMGRTGVSRRSLNLKSINRPCLSTARNRYFQWPPTFPYISATRHEVARHPWYHRTRFPKAQARSDEPSAGSWTDPRLPRVSASSPPDPGSLSHTCSTSERTPGSYSMGKRRRLNMNKAPRRTTPDYDMPVNATEPAQNTCLAIAVDCSVRKGRDNRSDSQHQLTEGFDASLSL
jgi:hypothetical protein